MSIKRVVLKNLEKMIEMIVLTGAETVLVGVELPPNYGELYTDSFEKMFVDLAVKFNLELIKGSIKEMVALDLMQDDGIHPNKLGHQMVEKEVRVKILPMLDQQATN
jgi:acyl-CoA thioesterase-1